MESANSHNDALFHQMETYNFDSQIKISLIFEDGDANDINIFGNYTEQSVRHAQQKGKESTVVSQSWTKTPSNSNFYNNVSVNNLKNTYNIEKESHTCEDRISSSGINYGMLNRQTVDTFSIPSNYEPIRQKTTNELIKPKSKSAYERAKIVNLLDKISENLIAIVRCYENCNADYQNNQQRIHSMEQYLRYKNHFFNLSYSTCISILLPQEHNQKFIHNFITRTIEIANRNMWYLISFHQLQYLLNGLMQWTKHKKKYLETHCNNLHHTDRIPFPTTVSTSSPARTKSLYNLNPNKDVHAKEHGTVCLFSSGPPGSEISISIDSTMLKKRKNTQNLERNNNMNSPITQFLLYDQVSKIPKMDGDLQKQTAIAPYTWNHSSYSNQPYPNKFNLENETSTMQQPVNILNGIRPELNQNGTDLEMNGNHSPVLRSLSRDSGFGGHDQGMDVDWLLHNVD